MLALLLNISCLISKKSTPICKEDHGTNNYASAAELVEKAVVTMNMHFVHSLEMKLS